MKLKVLFRLICLALAFTLIAVFQPARAGNSISDEDLDRIISELNLESFDRDELRQILEQEIEPGLTYWGLILSTLNEVDFVHLIYTQKYRDELSRKIIYNCYKKIRDIILMAPFEVVIKGFLQYSIVTRTISLILDIKKIFSVQDYYDKCIQPLETLVTYRALYHYLVCRQLGDDHYAAWETVGQMFPINSRSEWRDRAKSLGDKWQGYIDRIEEVRTQVRDELRDILLSKLSEFRPKASFTVQPASGFPPLTVHFDASGSQPSQAEGTPIESYYWVIEGPSSRDEIGPGPGYREIDYEFAPDEMTGDIAYEVTLTVQDTAGKTDMTSQTIWLKNPLQASFRMWEDPAHTRGYVPGPPPKTVYFDASSSSVRSGQGSIESYFWEFGDGSTGEGRFVSHTYTEDGSYIVTLTVTGGNYTSKSRDLVQVGRGVQFVQVYGTIQEDTQWSGYFCYVIHGSVTVAEGATLTIHPGTEIRADGGAELNVKGALIADGTSDQPIIFTSFDISPSKGDWAGLRFTKADTSILDHVVVKYAGTGIRADSSRLSITNSTISDNSGQGVWLYGSSGSIVGNTISDNGVVFMWWSLGVSFQGTP